MACVVTTPKTINNNTILDLLKRIDRMQKEAVNSDAIGNCNTCVFAPVYNTKPISIYTCNGLLTVNTTALDTATTNLFRIENINNDETVVLRLIIVDGETLTCTNNTITIKVSCICGIQCFDSITCTLCNQAGA